MANKFNIKTGSSKLNFLLLVFFISFFNSRINAQLQYLSWPLEFEGLDGNMYVLVFKENKINRNYVSGNNLNPGNLIEVWDSTGTRIFRTDLDRLYDKLGGYMNTMPGSHFIKNYQQAAIALPSLSNKDRYYFVFSAPQLNGNPATGQNSFPLSYYEIDKYLSINKTADVVNKSPITIYPLAFNKVTLVHHKNKKDYWITARFGDSLYAFSYTAAGFGAPVKSYIPVEYTLGNLKASIDGTFFVECDNDSFRGNIFSYNFDTETGKFSFQTKIDEFKQPGKFLFPAHDLAFSPNDSLYYVIDRKKGVGYSTNVFQYKRYSKSAAKEKVLLTHTDYDTVKSSAGQDSLINDGYSLHYKSGIQLAPNGKIYFVKYPKKSHQPWRTRSIWYLSEISQPNLSGENCNFKPYGFQVHLAINSFEFNGLPFAFYTPNSFADFTYTFSCNEINFINKTPKDFNKFTWYFGNGDSIVQDNISALKYSYASSGKYYVSLKAQQPNGYTAWFSDSISYIPNSVKAVNFSAEDSIGCQYTASTFIANIIKDTVYAKTGETFTWDFGDGTPKIMVKNDCAVSHIYTKTGNFKVTLSYSNGFCTKVKETEKAVNIIPAPKPGFSLSQNSGCAPLQIEITDKAEGNIAKRWYTFGNGKTDSAANASAIYTMPGKYFVTQNLVSENGCHTKDSAAIIIYKGFTSEDSVAILNVSIRDKNAYIHWQKNASAKSCVLTRRAENEATFTVIADVSDTGFYIDKNIKSDAYSYIYKLEATDSCGNILQKSIPAQTIHLHAEEVDGRYMLLNWNRSRENSNADFSFFYHADEQDWEKITEQRDTNYKHYNYAQHTQFKACYYVEAKERNDTFSSFSNKLCLPLKPLFWIPNAFSPNGDNLNDVFKVFAVGVSEFEMHIITRDNGHVFSSYNLNDGWDGTFRGKKMAPNEYVYTIKALTKDGYIYRRGCVMLLIN